jgi:hypothetical protein
LRAMRRLQMPTTPSPASNMAQPSGSGTGAASELP